MAKHRVGTPPSEVVKEILKTNAHPNMPPQMANRGIKNQAPHITWLADTSPDLSPHLILPTGSNSIYSVRNTANQLIPAMGSVDYGIWVLHTPVLLITASSTSDIIQTLLTRPKDLPEATRQELHHLFTPFQALKEVQHNAALSLHLQLKFLIEQNIDYQVQLASERYRDRIRTGRLVVIGSILDTSNTYGHGAGRLVLININGISSDKQLRRSTVLRNISPALLDGVGRKVAQ